MHLSLLSFLKILIQTFCCFTQEKTTAFHHFQSHHTNLLQESLHPVRNSDGCTGAQAELVNTKPTSHRPCWQPVSTANIYSQANIQLKYRKNTSTNILNGAFRQQNLQKRLQQLFAPPYPVRKRSATLSRLKGTLSRLEITFIGT